MSQVRAIDSDGHVYESEVTFSDAYWDPAFADQRPIVVATASGALKWLIDSNVYPRLSGTRQQLGGTPASKGGVPSAAQRAKQHDSVESSELRTAADRLAQLDAEHTAVQVNFPTMLFSWPVAYAPGLQSAIARAYNSWIADVSSQAPDRLRWVTVVDPGDPAEAAKEIHRTRDLGSVGIMVPGMVGHRHLDHPDFDPIWAAAADTGLPIAVHVGLSLTPLEDLYDTTAEQLTVPFNFPVLLAFHRLIARGVLDRYPNVRVGFLEAGCDWVPFMVDRMTENSGFRHRTTRDRSSADHARLQSGYRAAHEPGEYLRRGQVFVSFEVDDGMLPYLIGEYGDDWLLYASDIPHAHRMVDSAVYLEGRGDLSQATKTKLVVDNAVRFYGLG
jgi:predicted TIM-barrel fold metal-dependent hydrolase